MEFLIKLNICFKLRKKFRYIRTGIEVVITGRARNAFVGYSGTWVRIPPCPPMSQQSFNLLAFFFANTPSKSRYICPTIDLIHFACETILPIANKCLYRLMSFGCFQLNFDILLCLIYNITKVNH